MAVSIDNRLEAANTEIKQTYVHFQVDKVVSMLQILQFGLGGVGVDGRDDLYHSFRLFINTHQL